MNGWKNVDTWLVMLWLENDEGNYKKIDRIVKNTNNLEDITDNELYMELQDFHYGDEVDFSEVDLGEIRTALVELHGDQA